MPRFYPRHMTLIGIILIVFLLVTSNAAPFQRTSQRRQSAHLQKKPLNESNSSSLPTLTELPSLNGTLSQTTVNSGRRASTIAAAEEKALCGSCVAAQPVDPAFIVEMKKMLEKSLIQDNFFSSDWVASLLEDIFIENNFQSAISTATVVKSVSEKLYELPSLSRYQSFQLQYRMKEDDITQMMSSLIRLQLMGKSKLTPEMRDDLLLHAQSIFRSLENSIVESCVYDSLTGRCISLTEFRDSPPLDEVKPPLDRTTSEVLEAEMARQFAAMNVPLHLQWWSRIVTFQGKICASANYSYKTWVESTLLPLLPKGLGYFFFTSSLEMIVCYFVILFGIFTIIPLSFFFSWLVLRFGPVRAKKKIVQLFSGQNQVVLTDNQQKVLDMLQKNELQSVYALQEYSHPSRNKNKEHRHQAKKVSNDTFSATSTTTFGKGVKMTTNTDTCQITDLDGDGDGDNDGDSDINSSDNEVSGKKVNSSGSLSSRRSSSTPRQAQVHSLQEVNSGKSNAIVATRAESSENHQIVSLGSTILRSVMIVLAGAFFCAVYLEFQHLEADARVQTTLLASKPPPSGCLEHLSKFDRFLNAITFSSKDEECRQYYLAKQAQNHTFLASPFEAVVNVVMKAPKSAMFALVDVAYTIRQRFGFFETLLLLCLFIAAIIIYLKISLCIPSIPCSCLCSKDNKRSQYPPSISRSERRLLRAHAQLEELKYESQKRKQKNSLRQIRNTPMISYDSSDSSSENDSEFTENESSYDDSRDHESDFTEDSHLNHKIDDITRSKKSSDNKTDKTKKESRSQNQKNVRKDYLKQSKKKNRVDSQTPFQTTPSQQPEEQIVVTKSKTEPAYPSRDHSQARISDSDMENLPELADPSLTSLAEESVPDPEGDSINETHIKEID